MSLNDEQLLKAFGFERISENLWCFHRRIEDEGRHQDAIVLARQETDGKWTGFIPYVEDDASIISEPRIPEQALFHRTADVRDIVALAQNQIGSAESEILGVPPEEGFDDDEEGVWVVCPFHGTWDLVEKDRLGSMTEIYGPLDEECPDETLKARAETYRAWRDDFCVRLVAGTTPRP